MYLNPKPETKTKDQIAEIILSFTYRTLQDYLLLNEQFYKLKEKLSRIKQPEDHSSSGEKSTIPPNEHYAEITKIIYSINSIISGVMLEFYADKFLDVHVSKFNL